MGNHTELTEEIQWVKDHTSLPQAHADPPFLTGQRSPPKPLEHSPQQNTEKASCPANWRSRQTAGESQEAVPRPTHKPAKHNVENDKEYEEATAALKRSRTERRSKNRPSKCKAYSEILRQGTKKPPRIFPNRTAGTSARKKPRQTSQRKIQKLDRADPREDLLHRRRVAGPDTKTLEVRSTRTFAQVRAHEDGKENVPNRGRYIISNFCTNGAFPKVKNCTNSNNDENSTTNSGQNEPCKTFVGTLINIDMKCLDEFSVINLSDYSLNQTDLRLLSKGLTFTPTPDVANIGEIKSDLDRFLRKIRLRLYLFLRNLRWWTKFIIVTNPNTSFWIWRYTHPKIQKQKQLVTKKTTMHR